MELLLHPPGDASRHRPDARGRLTDIQFAFVAFPRDVHLSLPALRARLRDLCGVRGQRLRDLVALLRQVPRPD